MQLQWKYVIIVNLFTVLVMSIFFIIDDQETLKAAEDSLIANLESGANIREAAKLVASSVQAIVEPDKLVESKEKLGKELEKELVALKENKKEMADVIDVYVTDHYGRILASLTGMEVSKTTLVGKKLDKAFKLTDEIREKMKNDEIHIDGLTKYHDKYATPVFVPYTLDISVRSNETASFPLGTIMILFSASETKELVIDKMRQRHLVYVLFVSFALSVLITILTARMVIRPIRRLMEVVTEATNGNLDVRTSLPYSNNDIGKLAFGIDRMFRRIKTTQAERIEALANLAQGVAHEIKNPLNNLGLAVDNIKYVLSEEAINSEEMGEAHEYLEIMSEQITRMSQITEGFLDLTRPTQLDFGTVDLDDFIEKILADFTLQFSETDVKVVRNFCQELKDVEIDPLQMQKAISNIVQNSIQAMPRGGRIYVTTERIPSESGEMAVISIRDTGVGIPEEIQERIFDAYFTTKKREGGTGLGLALTRRIIESHRGKIKVESMAGAGASFSITLPIIQRTSQNEKL